MINQDKKVKIIRWIARIWGTIILAFVLFFVFGHIFGDEGLGLDKVDFHEKITFLFFPTSTIVGLLIAYKNELIGGLITILGMIGLFFMMPVLITNLYIMIGIVPPATLYLVYWFLSKKHNETIIKE